MGKNELKLMVKASLDKWEELEKLPEHYGEFPKNTLYKGDELYLNNSQVTFEGYISNKYALVIVHQENDFELVNDELRGTCTGCCVGDSDNKLGCTCDETLEVVSQVVELIPEIKTPIVALISNLHKVPLKVICQNKEIDKLNEQIISKKESLKSLILSESKLIGNIASIDKQLENLENKEKEFKQIFNPEG